MGINETKLVIKENEKEKVKGISKNISNSNSNSNAKDKDKNLNLPKLKPTVNQSPMKEDHPLQPITNTEPNLPIPKPKLPPEYNIKGSLSLDIRKIYKFKDLLGSGHFGQVRIAYRKDNPDKYYAIKSIKLRNLTNQNLIDLTHEVEIISSLDHPNIIKFYETYHDDLFFHIVMELCTGKEIFNKLIELGQLTEQRVAQIILQVIQAVTYLHSQGITHRDLKPENILFQSENNKEEIKLIDFGLSRKYSSNEKMHTVLGTPYYVAPEVLKGEYDEKCDIWSIGCLTYVMLSGKQPFAGKNNNEIFNRIIEDNVSFPYLQWKRISNEAIDFIQQCLNKNSVYRLSAKEALGHQWFKLILSEYHQKINLPFDVLVNLRRFTPPSKLKTMILKYLIEQLSFKEMTKLKKAFHAIDVNHSGRIDIGELERAFKIANEPITQLELKGILAQAAVDTNGNGNDDDLSNKINYSEFLIASMNQIKNINKDKLIQAFNYFDIDNNGYIDTDDLKNVLLRKGKDEVSEKELESIFSEVKAVKDKTISLEKFLLLFGIN